MFYKTLIETYMYQLLFIFPDRELTQNVYNGKLSNINNELIVTNARS